MRQAPTPLNQKISHPSHLDHGKDCNKHLEQCWVAYKLETDPKPESASLEQSMSGEFSIRCRTTHLHNALTVQKQKHKSLAETRRSSPCVAYQ